MSKQHKVKITVLKVFEPSEVFKDLPVTPVSESFEGCEIFEEGQEFIVGEDMNIPENFCSSAWHTIWNYVRTLAFGGSFPWFKEDGIGIACCADGLRPVVFRLERM